jgi:regulator of sirC expression with transglutaminase-like and TPR domain|tara:strand:+ start:339 stop:1169 length:831 start_codon:yes stop_codon:yes gene_type:complete
MNSESNSFISEWKICFSNPKSNLIEKCLKLAQILEYPNLDITKEIEKIHDLGITLKNSIVESKNSTYKISLLNEFLFQTCGFHGDVDDYYNPKNNFLNYVVDKKIGIPITLSILYSELGKHIGMNLRIIGFPSHVIVEGGEELMLDPFNSGKQLSVNDLLEILNINYDEEVELIPEYLNEITAEQILIRILRNLKSSYKDSYSYNQSLKCNKMILAINPNSPEEIRDVGILEEKMQNYENAIEFLNKYLELVPNAEDVDFILELIKKIRERKTNHL